MKEIFTMWKYPKMIILTVVSAALYAMCLIPFRGLQLIPGVAEIRPAAVLPPLLGILFGPAGAWGCGVGNYFGDLFSNTLTEASYFGAVGNFCFAMIANIAWGKNSKENNEQDFSLANGGDWQRYIVACVLSCASVAFIIAWGVEFLKLHPFSGHGSAILINNLAATLIFGPFLFKLFYSRSKAWNLLWRNVMSAEDRSEGLSPEWSYRLLWLGSVGGLIIGLFLSHVLYHSPFLDTLSTGTNDPTVVWGALPFLIIFLLGLLLA